MESYTEDCLVFVAITISEKTSSEYFAKSHSPTQIVSAAGYIDLLPIGPIVELKRF